MIIGRGKRRRMIRYLHRVYYLAGITAIALVLGIMTYFVISFFI